MSGFYKILANKALDESLMGALKFAKTAWSNFQIYLSKKGFYQILKFMSEHITLLNLVSY